MGPLKYLKRIFSPPSYEISWGWAFLNLGIICLLFIFVITSISLLFKSQFTQFEQIQSPLGEPLQKATLSVFKKELEEISSDTIEKIRKTEDYFNAAERDRATLKYEDAAKNYQKSIDSFPTLSAYLNLGNALLMAGMLDQESMTFRKTHSVLINF